MKCELIRDLIPLYAEGLCSEESKKEIAEHIKGCENCRLLCESAQPEKEAPAAPDEGETFKKVNRKIKKLTWKNWVFGGALAVVLAAAGVLTAGQILRVHRLPSFETIFQSIEVRKTARYIAEGDLDGYIDSISSYFDGYDAEALYVKKHSKESDRKMLEETFREFCGDQKPVKMKIRTKYTDWVGDNIAESFVTYKYADGKSFSIGLMKGEDGKFHAGSYPLFLDDDNDPPAVAIDFVNWHELMANGLMNRIYFKQYKNAEQSDRVSDMLVDRYQEQYREQFRENRLAFNRSDYEITDKFLSHYTYDEDKQMCYYNAVMTVRDEKGSATVMTRLYYDYKGMIPPTRDEIEIYPDGCSDELVEMLYGYFG